MSEHKVDMPKFYRCLARFYLALSQGWTCEDSRMTPGIPRMGMKRPDGSIAGVLSPMSEGFEGFLEPQMDKMGFPEVGK